MCNTRIASCINYGVSDILPVLRGRARERELEGRG